MPNTLNTETRTIFCYDNLPVLQGINSDCIDLIYLDPPFNKNKVFTSPLRAANTVASFSDIFREEDVKDEWVDNIQYENYELYAYLQGVKTFSNRYNYCYLVYMAIRLIECHRLLKDTGSIYLHCDLTMAHYLKIVMDCIFGEKNFRNEIIWHYHTSGNVKKWFVKNSDTILFYSKGKDYLFNLPKEKRYTKSKDRKAGEHNLGHARKEFFEDKDGVYQFVNMDNVWDIPYINSQSKERTGYPTQKPLALVERVIGASSNKGDIVLDPFCGCATTCVAAERLGRQWIGIDIKAESHRFVVERIKKEVAKPLLNKAPISMKKPPKRDDTTPIHPSRRQKGARRCDQTIIPPWTP